MRESREVTNFDFEMKRLCETTTESEFLYLICLACE